jgi:hypothetical protein
MVNAITENIIEIIQNPFGNYAVTAALEVSKSTAFIFLNIELG